MDPFYYLRVTFVFIILSCLFLAVLLLVGTFSISYEWIFYVFFCLGSRLWCVTVSLSLSHWCPGSGVVLDCIDS